ncbi:aminopeptidase P family protein [Leucobacter celer]|uniref:aminopeptidase P family protein n=1 Tax=Leucobacter celer TaxID=668625 RepID=UPI000B0C5D66|nr:aminopeptidase P family protein [Leucobacter celer]
MTLHADDHHRLSGLASEVRVLDWESSIPMSRAVRRDPRMPKLTEVPGFTRWLTEGWGEADRTPRIEAGAADAAAAHRRRLSEALPGRTLVVTAGRAQLRVGDTFFEFRADSDFLWSVGHPVEDGVLVMRPIAGGHDATLYLTPPARPGEDAFHADATHGELWVGPTPGLAELESALQLRAAPLSELVVADDALVAGAAVVAPGAGRALGGRARSALLGRVLSELRIFKDEWEIAELRRAVTATVEGFAQVRREIPRAIAGGGERWLQGTFDRHARTVGNGPGYASIVGAGAHAPILHWVRADGELRGDELLLLDMGVENRSGYTADVTRTVPVSGTFTAEQRAVHDLVERSHRAGLAAVRPGRLWADFHAACMEVLAQGLSDWGLLPVSVDEALSAVGQQHRRYIVCGVGHHLGLDVHDCESSRYENYLGGTIEPGMALTVEPGLYFHAWDLTVPPELRGIGVRIEDDLVVTGEGAEVISGALPIDAAGIEEWMEQQA